MTAQTQTNNAVSVAKPTDIVAKTIAIYVEKGELTLPKNYAYATVLKQTWLSLQEIKTKEYKPVLQACTMESITNSLLRMVTQGLDPNKNQGYFIPYGDKLTFTPSYFGYVTMAKRMNPNIEDIIAEVVYSGDVFEFKKVRGKNVITNHQSKLENMKKENIIAAYCSVYYRDGSEKTEIMSMDDIKTAWNQTPMGKPVDDNGSLNSKGTHGKFTVEMAKKTVTKRACKGIINTSDDFALLNEIMSQQTFDVTQNTVHETVENKANKEVFQPIFDEVTGEVLDDVIDVEHEEVFEDEPQEEYGYEEETPSLFDDGPNF